MLVYSGGWGKVALRLAQQRMEQAIIQHTLVRHQLPRGEGTHQVECDALIIVRMHSKCSVFPRIEQEHECLCW